MGLLEKYISSVLSEAAADIVSLGIKLKVKVSNPDDPSIEDIYTDIRGLPNVITVRQLGKKEDFFDGTSSMKVFVSFEDDLEYDVFGLRRKINNLPGVLSAEIKNYQGTRWSIAKKNYKTGTTATERGDA